MGHVRLGRLPATRQWQQVVALLGEGAPLNEIAGASAKAAHASLQRAGNDEAVARAFWLLTQLPLAARHKDYLSALRRLGLPTPSEPGLITLGAAVGQAIEAGTARSDLGEMAQGAATEALTAILGRELPALFGTTAEDVRRGLGRLASGEGFARLAREFFTHFVRRHLDYFLSRTVPEHVGAGKRFASVGQEAGFETALDLHCRETTRIVEAFAGGWYSKTIFAGGIAPEHAKRFVHVALRKIEAELWKRSGRSDG